MNVRHNLLERSFFIYANDHSQSMQRSVIPAALKTDLCPIARCDGGDGELVVGEEVPCVAALVDDIGVAVEDGDGELVLADILPNILDGVEFGGVGRQLE